MTGDSPVIDPSAAENVHAQARGQPRTRSAIQSPRGWLRRRDGALESTVCPLAGPATSAPPHRDSGRARRGFSRPPESIRQVDRDLPDVLPAHC